MGECSVKVSCGRLTVFFAKCPVGCDSELIESDMVIPECTLLKCPACGQLLSNADEKLYQETMKRFDKVHRVAANPKAHLRRLSRVQYYWRNAPAGTRILDVGSSFGVFLRILKDRGYDAAGVEPSQNAAAQCIEAGLDVRCGLLEDVAFPDEHFDVITMYEVIEHLKSPSPLLAECFRILKKEGMMFITTGNTDSWSVKFLKGRWDYFSMLDGGQGHISFFNPLSMRKLAEGSGFKVIAMESRRVSIVNKRYDTGLEFFLGKIAQEMLSAPAKLFNKGHDMLVVLKK
jgi:2-polyprenyl-3-methyl-5-hydroxy-6-metoxy-1,4-benzoquinol methylase